MQSASKNVGKKVNGFKCPSFSAPVKAKINQPSESSSPEEHLVPTHLKPGPSGDIYSENKGITTEVIKPTRQGDSSSNTDGISSASTSKQVVKKKPKFALKQNTPGSPKSSQKDKMKRLKVDNNITGSSDKTKTLTDDKKKSDSDQNAKKILPVRSLSDVEYDAIFDAVLENTVNLDMEDWQPKVTSPPKVKVSVKKKYSITVGKKARAETNEKKMKENDDVEMLKDVQEQSDSSISVNKTNVDNLHSDGDEKHTINIGLDGADSAYDETESVVGVDRLDVEKKDVVGNAIANADAAYNDDNEAYDDDVDDIVPNALDVNVEEVESIAQSENEITPAASVADDTDKLPVNITTPIKKKKKILKAKKKLEPKHLPFSDCKEPSMVDKICKMKQLKKKKEGTTPKKNRPSYCTKSMALPKQPLKSSEKKISRKNKMQQRELNTKGTWVMCCNNSCEKWRYLHDVSDPVLVPDRWTCSMNTNMEYNSCDKPEEHYDENEHIYTKFTEGSVVWAKMSGYPWWPAMVEIDPDTETYFSIDSDDSMFPTHYHVVFFDDHVSRVWVKSELIVPFTGDEENDGVVIQRSKKKHTALVKEVAKAKKNAVNSLKCTLKERIQLFGFAARYKGPWSSNKIVKVKKSKIAPKQLGQIDQTEYLDDSTVDDVLENTESLLDNVEEMLNSLDSQLDDSDEDSDFVPDCLVVVEKKSKKHSDIGVRFVEDKDSKTNDSIEDSETKIFSKAVLDPSPVFDEHPDKNHADSRDKKYSVGTGDKNDGKNKTGNRKKIKKAQEDKSEATNKRVSGEHKHETKAGDKKRKMKDQNEKQQVKVNEEKKKMKKCTKDFNLPKVNILEKEDVQDNKITHDVVSNAVDEKDIIGHESDEFDILAGDDIEMSMKSMENEILVTIGNDDNDEDKQCDELELFGTEDARGDVVNTLKSADQSLDEDVGDDFDLEEQSMYDTINDGSSKIRELGIQHENCHTSSEVEEFSDPFDLMEE